MQDAIERLLLRRRLLALSLSVALATAIGCGGSGEIENPVKEWSEDQKTVLELAEKVPDVINQGSRAVRALFTKEAAPNSSQMKELKDYMIQMEDVTVTGTTATATGTATKYGTKDYQPITWKAEKVDGVWKLSDVPLP